MRDRQHNQGFTLVELIVAVALLAILALPLLYAYVQTANSSARSQEIGDANVLGQSLLEEVEAAEFAALLADSVSLGEGTFAPSDVNGSPAAHVDGGPYYLTSELREGYTDMKAVISLTPTTATPDNADFRPYNEVELSQFTAMDVVFTQSKSALQDPDQLSYDRFLQAITVEAATVGIDALALEGFLATHTPQRERHMTLDIDFQAGTNNLSVLLRFDYDYTVDATALATLLPPPPEDVEGYTPPVLQAHYEESVAFSVVQNKTITAGAELPAIYVMFYPWYEDGEDLITINNAGNGTLPVFLVKQIDSSLSEAALATAEAAYRATLALRQTGAADDADGDGVADTGATVYSNLATNLSSAGGTHPTNRVKFQSYSGSLAYVNADFADDGSLVALAERDRLFDVTVTLYRAEDDTEILTLDNKKLD